MALARFFSRFRDLSLTSKLFVLLLPLAFVPLLAVLAQWHFIAKKQITDEVRARLQARWSLVEQGVKGFVARKEARIREIAESPLIQDFHGYLEYGLSEEAANVKGKIQDFFVQLSNEHDDKPVHRVCLSSPSKGQVIKVVRGVPVESIPPRQTLGCSSDVPDAARLTVATHPPDAEIKGGYLRFSLPLFDRWKRPWGFLSVDIPFEELSEIMERLPLPEEGTGIILNGNGGVVACAGVIHQPSGTNLCGNRDILERLAASIMRGDVRNPHGEILQDHVIFSGPLAVQSGWVIALVVPLERYERGIRQLGWASFVAGLLFFGAAIAVLLPITRRATAPLRRLEEHARGIATGDFERKLPFVISSHDEIGKLAGAFNTMVESLASRDLRLRQQAENLNARNEELTTLNRVISRAGSTLHLEELLPALLDEILAAMGLEIGAIRLVDEVSGDLYLAAHRGLSDDYVKSPPRIPIGGELTGRVVLTGQPVFIQDVQADPASAHLLWRVQAEEPLRCFAAVPLVAQSKAIGVLALGATGDRTFNQTELSSLISVGLGIGACIRNARLYRELSEAYERLQTLQDHLIRTEKLSAMGQLIAGVAHEISNPLTTILGYAQLLQARLENKEVLEEIRTIIEQARRCARVVEKLLAFARETEKKEEVLDLHEVIGDVLEPARLNLVLHNIEAVYRGGPGRFFVSGDRYQMQQVFLNLITNAQQALEEREPPRNLGIDIEARGESCVVMVSDNGPGIPPEVLRRVFDPFFTTKGQRKGTGLGLSVSYGIVKDHGGEIRIESVVGEGTRMKVQLPRVSPGARPDPSEDTQRAFPAWPGLKVLVVDDEPGICKFIEEALKPLQVEVITAGSLEDAVGKIRLDSPDFVLADIHLPDGDGFQLFDRLMGNGVFEPDRVAFTSGDIVNEGTRKRLKEIGRPYIRKPFDVTEIRRFLSECLHGVDRKKRRKT